MFDMNMKGLIRIVAVVSAVLDWAAIETVSWLCSFVTITFG